MNEHNRQVRVLTAGGARSLPLSGLPALLTGLADPANEATWIQLDREPVTIQALDDMGLDEVAVNSLRSGPERPRVEEFSDHLYISLFSVAGRRDGQGASSVVACTTGSATEIEGADGPALAASALPRLDEFRLFLGPQWIISVGCLPDADYEFLANRISRQVFTRGRGVSFVAYHICEWLVESLQPALEDLDARVDALEDQVVLATGSAPMDELFGLKRDLVELRRRVAPLRDVMQRLGSHGVLYIDPGAEVYFRDVHDDVLRVIELLDTYREILSSALDLHLSSVSNRLNRVMKKLTVVATVFMPLSFIVGLFGTNFTRMPFESYAWFIAMFVLLFVAGIAMVLWSWRRT